MTTAHSGPIGVAEFDAAPAADAAAELVPCCASKRWVSALVKSRPYRTLDRLVTVSDQALGRLDWADLTEALTSHPRIGHRAAGADPAAVAVADSSLESTWSRQEQAATATLTDRKRLELAEANRAYEHRFGHIFLICATGLSTDELLHALRSRLGNDPIAEREVVRAELKKIVRLRLAKAFR